MGKVSSEHESVASSKLMTCRQSAYQHDFTTRINSNPPSNWLISLPTRTSPVPLPEIHLVLDVLLTVTDLWLLPCRSDFF